MELFVLGAWLELGPGSKEQRLATKKELAVFLLVYSEKVPKLASLTV